MDEHFQHMSFAETKISSVDARDKVFATQNIKLDSKSGNHTLKLKVDTGTQGNTLPLRIYRRMHPKCLTADGYPRPGEIMKHQNTILTAYNGTRIEQLGVVTIPCQYSYGRWYDTQFFLVDTEGSGILSLPSLRQLDLVTLHCAVQADEQSIQSNENNGVHIDDLLKQYPNQYQSWHRQYPR